MDYDKLVNDDGVYLYKDDSFNTINASLDFIAETGNRENAVYDLLCDYMLKANKKYSTSEINKKYKEYYGFGVDVNTDRQAGNRFFTFFIDMVSPSVISDDYSKEAFEYAKDILLNPDFTRQDILDTIKRVRLAGLASAEADPTRKAKDLFYLNMFPNPELEYEYTTDMDYVKKLYDSITLDEMKELYEKTINKDKFYRGLVFGNTKDEEFKRFREIFPYKSKMDTLEFKNTNGLREGTLIIPSEDAEESSVYITYTMDNLDKGTKDILYDILNGSSELCSNIIRDKHGLAYEANARLGVYGNLLIIHAKIDKDNIDELIKASDEIVETIQDKEKIKPLLERAKESLKNGDYILSENRDSMYYELYTYINGLYKGYDRNKFIEGLDNVKEEDITGVTKTLKKRNVFMYRGDAK